MTQEGITSIINILIGMGIAGAILFVAYLIKRGRWDLFQRVEAPIVQQLQSMTLEYVALLADNSELRVGISKLRAQLRELNIVAVYKPDLPIPKPELAIIAQSPLVLFSRVLEDKFNVTELDDLAVSLDVPIENYNGDTIGKRAYSLLSYMHRRGELPRLEAEVRKLRPLAQWPDLSSLPILKA